MLLARYQGNSQNTCFTHPSLLHSPHLISPPLYLSKNPSYIPFHSELTLLHTYLISPTQPTLMLYPLWCHTQSGVVPNSKFLICLQVTFTTTHFHTFTNSSGAWELFSQEGSSQSLFSTLQTTLDHGIQKDTAGIGLYIHWI